MILLLNFTFLTDAAEPNSSETLRPTSIHQNLSALNDNFRDIARHRILSVAGKSLSIIYMYTLFSDLWRTMLVLNVIIFAKRNRLEMWRDNFLLLFYRLEKYKKTLNILFISKFFVSIYTVFGGKNAYSILSVDSSFYYVQDTLKTVELHFKDVLHLLKRDHCC